MSTQGQSRTRKLPKGGPGTATARKTAGLPEEYSKNIIPQGSFWRDGRKEGTREPFKKKWAWLSNGLRRACGDTSFKSKGAGNWLKAPPAPPLPTDRIGNRKTPTAKQRRSVKPEEMGWYGYLALKPVLPKTKGGAEEMDMWNIVAQDGRRGRGRPDANGNPSPRRRRASAATKKAEGASPDTVGISQIKAINQMKASEQES